MSAATLTRTPGGSGVAVSSGACLTQRTGRDQLDVEPGGCASRLDINTGEHHTLRRQHRRDGSGAPPAKIDPTPYRAHLLELRSTYSLSLEALASLTGLSTRTVVDLIYAPKNSKRTWISAETAQRLRSATFDLDALPDSCRVLSIGSIRRVQALALQGHSRGSLARRAGMSLAALNASLQRPTISIALAREIRDLYAQLVETPGSSSHATRLAVSAGWSPSHAWDEESIEDPRAEPVHELDVIDEVAIARVLSGIPTPLTRSEFLEAIHRGTQAGMSTEQLGRLLGRTDRTISRYRRLLRGEDLAAAS